MRCLRSLCCFSLCFLRATAKVFGDELTEGAEAGDDWVDAVILLIFLKLAFEVSPPASIRACASVTGSMADAAGGFALFLTATLLAADFLDDTGLAMRVLSTVDHNIRRDVDLYHPSFPQRAWNTLSGGWKLTL